MASSVAGVTLMDFSLWEHAKEDVYAVRPKIFKHIVERLQAAMTTVVANM
jgi:hypothetical protein